MTITIDDPPDVRACSECMSPLTYVYVFHLRRTIAVIPVQGVDRMTFRLHTCRMKAEKTWRHVQRVAPETTRRGASRARAVLAAKAKERTEGRR
jgi:hypothetical protein